MDVDPPNGIERDYPLAGLTTIRTGGPADYFARPRSEEALLELLGWADAERIEVGVIGSGSNLLVSDGGFRGVVLKLNGELSAIERDGSRVVCGGGARMPSAAAKVARWGLSGLEFGVNIPGTVGGARFSPVHANFVENRGHATTADVLTLMAAGRRRVRDRLAIDLEPEVQVLGDVEWPADWAKDSR